MALTLAHGGVHAAPVVAGLRLARRAAGAAAAAAQVGQTSVPRGVLGYGGAEPGRPGAAVFAVGAKLGQGLEPNRPLAPVE